MVDAKHGENYMGCTCFERARRRGRDLPDGKFGRENWIEIVTAITVNEILAAQDEQHSR